MIIFSFFVSSQIIYNDVTHYSGCFVIYLSIICKNFICRWAKLTHLLGLNLFLVFSMRVLFIHILVPWLYNFLLSSNLKSCFVIALFNCMWCYWYFCDCLLILLFCVHRQIFFLCRYLNYPYDYSTVVLYSWSLHKISTLHMHIFISPFKQYNYRSIYLIIDFFVLSAQYFLEIFLDLMHFF